MDEALVSNIFMLAPPLTIISSSFAVYKLYKNYKNKEISKKQFIFLSSKITGIKAAKIITLMVLLTVPIVGQVLGVYLISKVRAVVSNMLSSSIGHWSLGLRR